MTYKTAILILLLAALLAGAMVFIVRRYVHISFLQKHHEVAFTIFLQEGVIYGVFLAFVVSVVWTQFNQVGEEMQQEVSSLLVIAQLSPAFPEPMRQQIQTDLENYMKSVINQEWKTMSKGKLSPQTAANFTHLQTIFLRYRPQNLGEAAIFSETLRLLSDAREVRRIRIFHSAVSVPKVIWVILIGGGILVISLPLFFGMEHQWSQAFITGGLTLLITAILLLIYLLDNPFGKDLHVKKEIFIESLHRIGPETL